MLRTLIKAGIGAALCCAAPAMAAPAAHSTDPARIAAAERLLDAMHYDSLMERTIDAFVADTQKTFPKLLEQQVGQALPADLKDKVFTVIATSIRHAMTDNRADLRRGVALIYASRFTAAEIDHLIQLQSDPVLVKMQAQLPEIMTESSALGHAAVERELPNLARQIEQVVRDYYASGNRQPAT